MTQYWKPGAERGVNETIPVNVRHARLPVSHQRTLLPIASHKREILYAIEKYRILIIIGEPGTGKSTQIPQYLHEAGWTRNDSQTGYISTKSSNNNTTSSNFKAVVCTQPRRVAAVNVSARVAEEYGCKLGEEVGYNVRFHTKISSKTVIKYCTDGVLLRETLSDPLLSKYSVVMVDEAHEQSLQSDLLLGILKKIVKKRPDLRIIITSATINTDKFVDYFMNDVSSSNKDHIHVLSIQGRQHPVDIYYLSNPVSNYIRAAVDTVISIHKSHNISGDILVFLPGSEDIDHTISLLNEHLANDDHSIIILPLHSSMPNSQQMAVFEPTPSNHRKIVVATNIAETSVTIEGILYVVDTGYVKLNYFNVDSNVEYLVTSPISQAAANQRAGRAGRTSPGTCYRLYTEDSYQQTLSSYTPSEMQRVDISWGMLQLKALGVSNIARFDYLNPPASDHMIYALEFLYSINAMDDDGTITPLGEKISEMSIDVRLAKCLISSYDLGCSEEMLSIAAMCSVEYPFITLSRHMNNEAKSRYWDCISNFAVLEGDHLSLLNIYRQFEENGYNRSWCDSMNLQFHILSRAKEIRSQLHQMLIFYLKHYHDIAAEVVLASCGNDTVAIRKSLVSGYFSNAARLGADGHYRTIRGQVKVSPHTSSVIAKYGALPEWIIFHEAMHSKDMAQIRDVTKIDPIWLLEMAPHYYKVNKTV